MEPSTIVTSIQARAVPLRGNDIDTDRIIPARYLRCVTFDGLGEHVFEDDRKGLRAKGQQHRFDDPRYRGAGILFVNKNFGCGSSREHAPQALMRWGIRAVVGESFAEIFYGNCVSLGIPCVTATERVLESLLMAAEKTPDAEWKLDLDTLKIHGPIQENVAMPEGPRSQFMSGKWNPMAELLSHLPEVEKVASSLSYFTGRWG